MSIYPSPTVPDILIDIGRLLYRRLKGHLPTGIDRVGMEYVRHYAGQARAVLTWGPFSSVLSRSDSERAFRLLLDPRSPATLPILRLLFKAYLRWWATPSVAGSVLLNTSHTGLDYTGYAAGLRHRGAQAVYFVHDLIPITHPQYCRVGERKRHETRMHTALATGGGIVVNSQDTLATLARFAGECKLPMRPATVAPLASNLPKAEAGPRPIPEPYFVVVGTIEPRKNHILLFQLWRKLVARHSSLVTRHGNLDAPVPRLVVIGQRGWECESAVELLERSSELRGFVIERGACSDREMVTYLHHAQALLFPSFVEGYGIPLAEALSLGTPAIASNLPVFREIAGEIPEYADPRDDERWMELVTEYSRPASGKRAAQIERLKGFQATTWIQHFQKVDTFLSTL